MKFWPEKCEEIVRLMKKIITVIAVAIVLT